VRRESAMVPLDRALVSSYRLSIVTMSLSATVWSQFATQVFGEYGHYPCLVGKGRLAMEALDRASVSVYSNHLLILFGSNAPCKFWGTA